MISGADVSKAAATMAADRRPDLWAGVGLALCCAGPAGSQAFLDAKQLADSYASDMAMGVAMACTARVKDQSLLAETREAIIALWDRTPEALAERVEAIRQSVPSSALADGAAYAAW